MGVKCAWEESPRGKVERKMACVCERERERERKDQRIVPYGVAGQ